MRATNGPGLTGLLVLAGPLLSLPYEAADAQASVGTTRDQRIAIVVTTASDVANGNTSGPASLASATGPDGISLREAILVTNNDPGLYQITFANDLAGDSIRVGSASGIDLPTLVGGGVWIDGDIDGDGRPDVTLRGFRSPSYCMQADFLCPGFRISSSGNRLLGLMLVDFANGVLFTPVPASDPLPYPTPPPETHQTYSNNVVSGLVMRDIGRSGISMNWGSGACDISSGKPEWACETNNTWSDTALVNNSIRTAGYGIDFPLPNSIGDRVEHFTISGNTIRIERSRLERIGIKLEAGLGVGSVGNGFLGLLIARNTIEGHQGFGIRLGAGTGAGDANEVARVRILDNRIRAAGGEPSVGIDVFLGESSWQIGWDLPRIEYGDRNVQRDIVIRGNSLTGAITKAITAGAGSGGSAHNAIDGLRIEGNTIEIRGLVGVLVNAGDNDEDTAGRVTRENQVSDVSIANNSITVTSSHEPEFGEAAGGIVLLPGTTRAHDGEIRDVLITDNRVDAPSQFNAVELWGGAWWHRSSDVDGIVLSDVVSRNRLACVVMRDNLIKGVRDELSVVVGGISPDQLSASKREAALGGCGLSPADLVVAAESPPPEGGPRSEPTTTGSELPWALIALGSAAVLIGVLAAFALRRRS